MYQLAPYQRYFRAAFFFSFLSLPFAGYYALYGLGQLGFSLPVVDAVLPTMEWIYFVYTLFFTAVWMWAVFSLSRELMHTRLISASVRALLFFAVTQVVDFTGRLPIPFIRTYQGYFALPAILLRLILIFLNMYLIYQCYRYICPEGQEFAHLQADKHIETLQKTAKGEKK